MFTRELSPGEWRAFFDCFGRRFRGRPMAFDLGETAEDCAESVARRLPLVGVTAEPAHGRVETIAVVLGDCADDKVVHVVRDPCRVRVVQITGGEDEVLLIDSGAGPAARVDFRHVDAVEPAACW